jgi:predicted aminopeptidase
MLIRPVRLFLNILFLLLMLCCLIWNQLVIYGISQGKGQLNILINAQPVEDILKDPGFPDTLKQKLILISEIKKYAVDSLGINPSDNYTRVYNQHGKPILWTVSASDPFGLKAKEWNFPFLGTVSYKGFFNKKALRKEILNLVKNHYDVDVYSPSGWSTLGWFRDPVLSNMLYKDDGSLANLIIHELTHGTLYVKNNVTFNENLANFIGDKGAQQFLKNKYGANSKEYLDYINNNADEKIYNDYILKNIEKLKNLYSSFKPEDSGNFKMEKKKELITEIVLGVNRLPLTKKKRFFNYTLQAFSEGNAFFMAFSRYDSQYDVFEKEFREKYNSDLRKYLEAMKAKYPSL